MGTIVGSEVGPTVGSDAGPDVGPDVGSGAGSCIKLSKSLSFCSQLVGSDIDTVFAKVLNRFVV